MKTAEEILQDQRDMKGILIITIYFCIIGIFNPVGFGLAECMLIGVGTIKLLTAFNK
jgi:hypothetical protein